MSEAGEEVQAFSPAVSKKEGGGYEPCMHDLVSGSDLFNRGQGSFSVGRIVSPEVRLRLAERKIKPRDGLKVLAFAERPSYGTAFEVGEDYSDVFDAAVRDDGVYLVKKGTAPSAETFVMDVVNETGAQFPFGQEPSCAAVALHGSIALTSDCDWTGLGRIVIPDGAVIDLNGHDLSLAGFQCAPGGSAGITDLSGGGALHVSVAENDIVVNDGVVLGGGLRLVKEGAGTFVAARQH